MKVGNEMEKFLDYTLSDGDILNMDEDMLYRYLMFTDRDRKDLDIAEELYWKIIREINRRMDTGEIEREEL